MSNYNWNCKLKLISSLRYHLFGIPHREGQVVH